MPLPVLVLCVFFVSHKLQQAPGLPENQSVEGSEEVQVSGLGAGGAACCGAEQLRGLRGQRGQCRGVWEETGPSFVADGFYGRLKRYLGVCVVMREKRAKRQNRVSTLGVFWLRYDLLPFSKVSVYADGSGLVFRSCYSRGVIVFQIKATKQNNGFGLIS